MHTLIGALQQQVAGTAVFYSVYMVNFCMSNSKQLAGSSSTCPGLQQVACRER